MAEFAPALFILFFCALFPAIDLIGVALSYFSCSSLNDLQLREAVREPKSQVIDPKGTVQLTIPLNWRNTLLGGLGATIEDPQTQVDYIVGKYGINVTLSTTFTIHPLFPIPFFAKVPALGAPVTTTISHTRMLENPSFSIQ